MSRRVSIAEARNHLTQWIRRAEEGERVELTRRGRPVAALIGYQDLQSMRGRAGSFYDAAVRFRERLCEEDLAELGSVFDDLRDRSVGRPSSL